MRGHADAATLAAFREELLSARKAAQVSAHLTTCPRCAALEAQLAEVTSLLNHATAPPMPDALTARIQAALSAEATARAVDARPLAAAAAGAGAATPGPAGHNGSQSTAGRDRTGDRTGRRAGWRGHDRSWLALRVAAVTAAVAVIAGGGYGVAQLLTGSPAVTGNASGGGVAAPNIRVTGPVPRTSAGGLNAPAASSGTGSSARSSVGTLAPLVVSSGTDYQPASLGARASAVLARLTKNAHSPSQPGPNIAPTQNQANLFPDLQSCLLHIAHGQHPLLVDLAKYQGHPALVVVLPATNGGQPRALVLAPGCTSTTAHVLATATLPRSG
ncbi:MAG TPA: hypothetical protein VGI05_02395 [Streptosporangiaceae bacterium]